MALNLGLPDKPGLFITGTDTGVGKTLIAGAIAKILSQEGQKVGVFKPIASGCRREREGLVSPDAEFLAYHSNCDFPLSVISPVCYATPAAPIVCERCESRKVDFEQISAAYQYICDNSDIVIVEGIGGVRVPISDGVDVLDLAGEFKLPVVIVARPNLGTINHTFLTIDSIRLANLELAGIVICGFNELDADVAETTGPEVIARCGRTQILSVVHFDEDSNVDQGLLGQFVIDALSDCDWAKLAGK